MIETLEMEMPHFIFRGRDGVNGVVLRAALREAHRSHLRREHAGCLCICGGPLLDRPDGNMIGTLLIFEANCIGDVERMTLEDPYVKAGLFVETQIECWWWTLGAPSKD